MSQERHINCRHSRKHACSSPITTIRMKRNQVPGYPKVRAELKTVKTRWGGMSGRLEKHIKKNGGRPERSRRSENVSLLQHNFLFGHHLAYIDQGITHTAQSSVDAHPGELRYFFEAKVGIMSQDDYFTLLGRKQVH